MTLLLSAMKRRTQLPEVDGAIPSGQPDRLQGRGAASDAVMSDENADEPSQLDRNREFTEGVLSGRSSTSARWN
jgi:hypothetical protein